VACFSVLRLKSWAHIDAETLHRAREFLIASPDELLRGWAVVTISGFTSDLYYELWDGRNLVLEWSQPEWDMLERTAVGDKAPGVRLLSALLFIANGADSNAQRKRRFLRDRIANDGDATVRRALQRAAAAGSKGEAPDSVRWFAPYGSPFVGSSYGPPPDLDRIIDRLLRCLAVRP
jgi:hypothetical protein